MIQRRQTLFLFLSALLGFVLLFVAGQTLVTTNAPVDVFLIPLQNSALVSTSLHLAAIGLNFTTLILSFITVFLYRKRDLQVKLCYVLMLFWLALCLMMALGNFTEIKEPVVAIQKNYMAIVLGILGICSAWFAARFIKKDIELLKSADRIR